MRYIGNKTRMLKWIDKLIISKGISGGTFADIFSGTGSVSDHFKDRFKIVSNDIMNYAAIFSRAKINYSNLPLFKEFQNYFGVDPFSYWNNYHYENEFPGFVTKNFSPDGNRKFFQRQNAIKIDTIRRQIDVFEKKGLITHEEWNFLLASLLESVMGVSNTSGTYEAFFKVWESRSKKEFLFQPLSMEKKELYSHKNRVYCEDANNLVRSISGDVVYIDTPYTTTQYASAYHVLETIALNDNPEVRGKTGRRINRKMSDYSKRSAVKYAFEDLLRQLKFDHVIISYSNQSLLPIEDLIEMISKFSLGGKYEITSVNFREYSNLNSSNKSDGEGLQEYLIYFQKDKSIVKSPLNYAGSKDTIVDLINASLPRHVSDFVDAMGGAFNVGGNIIGLGKVYYNEKSRAVFDIQKMLLTTEPQTVIYRVTKIVNTYRISKGDKDSFRKLRAHYNKSTVRDPAELFVLTLYSFQHMIRFNSSGEYNVPVGNSGVTMDVLERIKRYRLKMQLGGIFCSSFEDIDFSNFDENTVFYFDPPYIITSAAYNDGKRMDSSWTKKDEINLLNYLELLNNNGKKFLLSNVVEHNGSRNDLLLDWVKHFNFYIDNVGVVGRRYQRKEVLVRNYLQ